MGRTARGEQKVNLHRYCWTKGIVIHELAHAIGFFHEQSRSDRDSYVKILYENIEKGQSEQHRDHAPLMLIHYCLKGPVMNPCIMGKQHDDPHRQNEKTEIRKIYKFGVYPAYVERETAFQKLLY